MDDVPRAAADRAPAARGTAVPAAPAPRSGVGRLSSGWRPAAAAAVLLIVDWLAVLVCLAAVWWVRSGPLQRLVPGLSPILPLADSVAHLYAFVPWMLTFGAARLYTRRAMFWDEVRRVFYACTAATLLAVALSFAGRHAGSLSRLVIAGTWLTTIAAVPLGRHRAKRLLAAVGLWNKRILVIGGGDSGARVCGRLRANPELGYEPVAFVDDDPRTIGRVLAGLPVRGPLSTIPQLVRELDVTDVVVAMPDLPRERLLHVISLCEGHVRSIRLMPDLFSLASVGVEAEDLDGVLLLHMRWNLAKPGNRFAKRTFDLIVSAVAALVLAPLWGATALAIRFDSRGPVLFVQERIGRGRRPFRCLKFRTMYVDGEERLRAELAAHPRRRVEWERYAKLRSHDPRVTRVGRLLRRFSLDELPQLVNVWRGEMTLVGPRPYVASEIERAGDLAETVLKAPPGITGLWQVSGRNNLPFEQRLRLDEYYVRNWSLWLDAVVLLKTAGAVLRGRGAY